MTILGIPTYGSEVKTSLLSFVQEAHDARLVVVSHRPTPVARNYLAALALRTKQHLVQVDHDAAPAPSTWAALVERVTGEVCVAAVPYCSSTGGICVGENSPQLRDVEGLEGWHEVDNCGTHCVAVSWQVYEQVPPPWYEYEYNDWHTSLRGPGEDTLFHRKVRDAGVPLYVNWSLWAGHVCDRLVEKPRSLTPEERWLIANT